VQKIKTHLRPKLLDEFGLVAAVEWEAKEFEKRTSIACHVEMPEDERLPLDTKARTELFRVFQEIMANVAKHAGARNVRVLVRRTAALLELKVCDDGRGIAEAALRDQRASGLLEIRERARFLEGQVLIEGRPGLGTTVTVQLPLGAGEKQGRGTGSKHKDH
jgi:signal transduction histidine kinase